jgi:hypothetical protein
VLQDLSAYEIASPMPDLRLEEIAVSNGQLCGSVFLDREFLLYVESKIGSLGSEDRQTVSRTLKPFYVSPTNPNRFSPNSKKVSVTPQIFYDIYLTRALDQDWLHWGRGLHGFR